MKKYYYNQLDNPEGLCKRPAIDLRSIMGVVEPIFADVRKDGDEALRRYTQKFDGVDLSDFEVSEGEIDEACGRVDSGLKEAFKVAVENIRKFHTAQMPKRLEVKTMAGVKCFREARAIEKVGIYVPGGSAPLPSTALMLAIPAKIAGCSDIIMCTPPNIDDTILYVARLAGVDRIFRIGGAQAIAAMALGTESVPAVYKICGPGNQYVTAAKILAQNEGVSIDMPAGPSEALIVADGAARTDFVAADLLSQAEHGADSQVVLVCNDEAKVDEILAEVDLQLEGLSRKDIAAEALKNSFALIVDDLDQAMAFSNQYAPEHLILNLANPQPEKVVNAGSVFIGQYSCESAGDYASGTNHTLPTYGCAKAYSGVSVDSFLKQITFQEISKEGASNIGPVVEKMAAAEGLDGHKNSMTLRLNSIK